MTTTYAELLRLVMERQRDDESERAAARRRIELSPEFQELLDAVQAPYHSPGVELLVERLVAWEIEEGRL